MKARYLFFIAIIAGAFSACNSTVENDHDGDSITVDSVVTSPDSVVVVDTAINSGTDTL